MLLLAGSTQSLGAGANDVFLLKTDLDGAILWQQTYGGSGDDYPEDLMQSADGSILVTGITSSYGAGLKDIYLLKLDSSGDSIWTRTYGGPLDDGGASLAPGDSGKIMLFNYTDNYGAVNRDWYLLQVDENGDSISSALIGTAEYEEAQSIERTSDGNFILYGHSAGFGNIEHNTFAAKVNVSGGVLWQNVYGGAQHDGGEHGLQTDDGGYIFAGRSASFGNNSEQGFIVKTDAGGSMLWHRDVGGDADDSFYNMLETEDAWFFVGNTQSFTNGNNDVFLVKIIKP
jgi:hypothetical protein